MRIQPSLQTFTVVINTPAPSAGCTARRWSWCSRAPGGNRSWSCRDSSIHASVCFIQFLSSRSGKSSRACAPRLSVRLAAEVHRHHGLHDQIVEFQRLDQIGIPDQRAVGHRDVADAARAPCESGSGLRAAPRRCGTPRNCSASRAACCRAASRSACRRRHSGNDRAGRSALSAESAGNSGCLPFGVSFSAQRNAAARPNTTRSISELEPSRLAPCTETQAASPTAIKARARSRCRRRSSWSALRRESWWGCRPCCNARSAGSGSARA